MLPLEILERIALHLPRRDVYYCLIVCRAWYFVFLPCLYRSTEISSDANACSVIQHADLSLCRRVRELVLEDGMLSIQGMRGVRKRCPSLDTLHFWWWRPSLLSTLLSLRSPSDYLQNREDTAIAQDTTNKTIYFESPLYALKEFRGERLSQLKLSCLSWDPPSIFNNAPNGSDFDDWLRRVLKPMPNLKQLVMQKVLPTLDVRHLGIIHACCPLLTHLDSEGPGRIQFNGGSHRHHYRPVSMGTVVARLQSLRLAYDGGWSFTANAWLSYIARCYPDLTALRLENLSTRAAWINPVTPSDQRLIFPNLRRAHLIRLELDYATAVQIQEHAPLLYDLSIVGSCHWSSSTSSLFDNNKIVPMDRFDAFIANLGDDLIRLSASLPEVYDRRLTIFCLCEKLHDLSLCGGYGTATSCNTSNNDSITSSSILIDLPMLLVTCRVLRRLTLTNIELSNETLCEPIQSPIERLELHQVTLTSDNINNVHKYCANLTSFIVRQCYWRITSMEAMIGVQLQLAPRHYHSIQVDDQRILWTISAHTITWEPIQEFGLFNQQQDHHSLDHVNNNSVNCRRWVRIMTSLGQEKKLTKRQPQPVRKKYVVELPPTSMEPLLQTSYNDVLRMHTAAKHCSINDTSTSTTTATTAAAINDHSSCISKRGGFMTISFMNVKYIALNGLVVQC